MGACASHKKNNLETGKNIEANFKANVQNPQNINQPNGEQLVHASANYIRNHNGNSSAGIQGVNNSNQQVDEDAFDNVQSSEFGKLAEEALKKYEIK